MWSHPRLRTTPSFGSLLLPGRTLKRGPYTTRKGRTTKEEVNRRPARTERVDRKKETLKNPSGRPLDEDSRLRSFRRRHLRPLRGSRRRVCPPPSVDLRSRLSVSVRTPLLILFSGVGGPTHVPLLNKRSWLSPERRPTTSDFVSVSPSSHPDLLFSLLLPSLKFH